MFNKYLSMKTHLLSAAIHGWNIADTAQNTKQSINQSINDEKGSSSKNEDSIIVGWTTRVLFGSAK